MFVLHRFQRLCIAVLMASLPVAGYLALEVKLADRGTVATLASVVFASALNLLFVWPLVVGGRMFKKSTKGNKSSFSYGSRSNINNPIRDSALIFLFTSFIIHLTWELGWLILVSGILGKGQNILPNLADSIIGYPWFVYIDTGDSRYLTVPHDLLVIECLSVVNGIWGLYCLRILYKAKKKEGGDGLRQVGTNATKAKSNEKVFAFMGLICCAAVHFYSCCYYFLSELISGCEHCDLSGTFMGYCNVVFSFFLANVPWIYMPLVVGRWVMQELGSN